MPNGLKVYFGCPPDGNPFLGQLIESLGKHESISSVEFGQEGFWRKPQDCDVLHLHWPEALFGWREPSKTEIEAINDGLKAWKSRTQIVTTVHNRFPHHRDTENFRALYRTIYSVSDGIVHMGRASLKEFRGRYPDLEAKSKAVILHGNYSCFKNVVSRAEARRWLGLPADEVVCLVFGALRNNCEIRLLYDGFRLLKNSHKRLLVTGRLRWSSNRIANFFARRRFYAQRNVSLINAFIPSDEVQYYLNAADMLVIPRIGSLNSGNVALGFTFGKVVIGPDDGVIGEMLRETGNPVFVPESPKSLAFALQAGIELSQENLGKRNHVFAVEKMHWLTIAAQHVTFYQELLTI